MLSRKSRLIGYCVLALLFLTASGPSWAGEKKLLTWGTTQSTSGVFPYYVFTAKILNESIPEINITVRATGGGVQNLRMLEKGEIDIGSSPTTNSYDFATGKGIFKGKAYPDLRLMNLIMTNGLQMVVSERSEVKTLKDLEGKKFCPGAIGGGIEQYVKDIFQILGIHPDLRFMSYADAIEAMKDERIIGVAKMGVPDALVLDIASSMKIRILSFDDADVDKIVKNLAGLTKAEYPGGIYKGVGGFKTMANEWSDFVRKDFPADVAYKIVKTVWEHRAEIYKMDPRFLGDRLLEGTLEVRTNPLHPGVVKFCREQGLTVPARLIPPEMK